MTTSDQGQGGGGTFACPGCAAVLTAGVSSCPRCGIRLVGEDAARLWAVNRQIAALRAEADRLLASMRAPVSLPPPDAAATDVEAPAGSITAGIAPLPPLAPTGPTGRGRGPSGQGVLLTLGGLLLLAGASVFVVVVWLVVGVYGQALLMALATVAAAVVARLLGSRGLGAGAEAFAVIACGLLVLDLWGAHHLGFAGLDDVPGWPYTAIAALFGAACAVVADRVTRPRRVAYAPFAALLATLAPWAVVAALDPDAAALVAALAGAFVVDLVVLAVIVRTEAPGWRSAPAVIAAAVVAALGLVAFAYSDLAVGFDTARSRTTHLEAAALALVVPVLILLAAAARLPDRLGVAGPLRIPALWVVASSVAAAIGMVVFDGPIGVVVAVAVVLAAVIVAAAVWSVHATVRIAGGVATVALGLLAFWVAADHAGLWTGSSAPVHALPALLWAIAAIVRAITDREVVWVVVAEVATALTAASGLEDASTSTAVIVSACLVVANGVLAGIAARRPREDPVRGVLALAVGTEIVAVLSAAAWSVTMLGLSLTLDDRSWTVVAFWIIGAVAVAHASAPRRLAFAYLGALAIALGIWVLLGMHDVGTVEAYSLPLAAMLAVVGLVQSRRSPAPPTLLTDGPALAVALFPSLVAGIGGGSAQRVAIVILAGAVALVAGLELRRLGPTVMGIITLVVIALTKGGPLLAYVPSWLMLTVVGACLLTIGVRWEATVTAGRRAGVWLGSLR